MEDLRHGQLCATLLAPHLKPGNAPDPRTFMLRPPEERELTAEETETLFDALLGVSTPVRAGEQD